MFGLAKVHREEGGREALGNVVVEGEGFGEVFVFEDVEDGGEGLVFHDVCLGGDFNQSGADEEGFGAFG